MLRPTFLLLVAVFALATLSLASHLGDNALGIDGIERYLFHEERRQATGTGSTPPVTSAPPPPSSPRPPSSPTLPTPTSDPVTFSDPPAPSSPAPGSSRQSTPTQRSATPVQSSDAVISPRSTAIVRTSALVSTSLQQFVTVFTTESNGQQFETTSTGTSSVPLTTGQVVFTDPPTSQSGGDNGGTLSESNKKVIAGVVGGVGGALLLGGLALVFWRMKKRQRGVTADDHDLLAGTGSALGDKTQVTSVANTTPFQSNLEQYHNPGVRPNAAANF